MRLLLISVVLLGCHKAEPLKTPPLLSTWFAHPNSIAYLNVQHMALDLRADSSYRYFYRVAPTEGEPDGAEYTEGGAFRVRGDSLRFFTEEVNGEPKQFGYARKFRLLSDTTDWPLRVTYMKQGTVFEVYFQEER
ncbi:MAG: hypothetical protein H6505_03410 [Calditrichaeota bacterium]|nr:hypothetical protein [Calditrichota bacterium]